MKDEITQFLGIEMLSVCRHINKIEDKRNKP